MSTKEEKRVANFHRYHYEVVKKLATDPKLLKKAYQILEAEGKEEEPVMEKISNDGLALYRIFRRDPELKKIIFDAIRLGREDDVKRALRRALKEKKVAGKKSAAMV